MNNYEEEDVIDRYFFQDLKDEEPPSQEVLDKVATILRFDPLNWKPKPKVEQEIKIEYFKSKEELSGYVDWLMEKNANDMRTEFNDYRGRRNAG